MNSPVSLGTGTQVECVGWALAGAVDTNGLSSGSART